MEFHRKRRKNIDPKKLKNNQQQIHASEKVGREKKEEEKINKNSKQRENKKKNTFKSLR